MFENIDTKYKLLHLKKNKNYSLFLYLNTEYFIDQISYHYQANNVKRYTKRAKLVYGAYRRIQVYTYENKNKQTNNTNIVASIYNSYSIKLH